MSKLSPLFIALTIAASSVAVNSQAHANSKLSDFFYSVQSADPRVVSNEHGTIFTGGNLRIRTARDAYYDVASFQPPSIQSGCGGIDIFAGSFGLISKDQLVQTGRAVVQGAAAYYFGLALNSICPVCNAEMTKLQDMLNEMNKYSRMGCEGAVERIGKWSKERYGQRPEEMFENVRTSVGGAWEAALGLIGSQADKQDPNPEKEGTVYGVDESVAEFTLLGNSTYQIIANELTPDASGVIRSSVVFAPGGLFGETPVQVAEFFMSLGGTQIYTKDEQQNDNLGREPLTAAFTVQEFLGIQLSEENNNELTLYNCHNPNALGAARCSNVSLSGGRKIKPLAEQIKDILYGESFDDSVFGRILSPTGHKELTNNQANLFQISGISPYVYAALLEETGIQRDILLDYLEKSLLLGVTESLVNNLDGLIIRLVVASDKSQNTPLREDGLERMNNIREAFKAAIPQIRAMRSAPEQAISQTITSQAALSQLQSRRN